MASLYVPSRAGSPTGNGYKLYFYETGTTNPINTYSQSDLAMGHENTNPVVADSNGLFGPIYLLPTPDYKVILTNAVGTAIWTTDPILTAAVSVVTAEGDLIVGDSNGAESRLPIGAAAKYLRSDGTTASWEALALADATGTLTAAHMPVGTIIQEVIATTNAYTSHTTVIPYDDTIPQIGEGDLLLTASITPSSTSNHVNVTAIVNLNAGNGEASAAVFRGAGANAIGAAVIIAGNDPPAPVTVFVDDAPSSVAAQSYTLRVGPSTGTLYVNGVSGGRIFGGALTCSLLLQEIVK